MTEFEQALVDALTANGGKVSFQEVVDLLPPTSKHKVMKYLVSARNGGHCKYSTKRVDGEMQIVITSPNYVAPVAPSTSPRQPLVGGSN